MSIEHIQTRDDAWLCLCGNIDSYEGFWPCDKNGNEMVPSIDSDWDDLYVCGDCSRIINQETLEVIGQNPEHRRLDEH